MDQQSGQVRFEQAEAYEEMIVAAHSKVICSSPVLTKQESWQEERKNCGQEMSGFDGAGG